MWSFLTSSVSACPREPVPARVPAEGCRGTMGSPCFLQLLCVLPALLGLSDQVQLLSFTSWKRGLGIEAFPTRGVGAGVGGVLWVRRAAAQYPAEPWEGGCQGADASTVLALAYPVPGAFQHKN